MASLTIDFLENRRRTNRYKRFILPLVLILAVAGSGLLGFYLYQKSQSKPKAQGGVAGAKSSQLPKEWLLKYFGTDNENDAKVGGPSGDPDDDGLVNLEEYQFGTNPLNPDTDGDGAADGFEIAFGQNPNGEGELQLSQQSAEEYLKSLGKDYEQFSQENIQKQVEELFQPDREIVLDLPADSELKIINKNDKEAFEKYYEDTKALGAAEELDLQNIQNNLFDLSDAEFDAYINKLDATIKVLKDTPVPSEIVNIHKLKIAGLRAGIRMFELVRDSYQAGAENRQFWADFFYQTVAAKEANDLELATWHEIGQMLKDQGGL